MQTEPPRFAATVWRDSQELLQVRQDMYSSEPAKRQRAANKVFAWRVRRPDGIPLLLDSTADIVDVILQDERRVLQHNPLRLLYATALSRFLTGLADTQIELTRDRPAWFPPGKSLQLPLPLFEVRHRIVHRHLPSLAELKVAAKESLDWLWEWYWKQLDYAFGQAKPEDEEEMDVDSMGGIQEKLQAILKTYVKDRKNEIKIRKSTSSKAAEQALSTYTLRFGSSNTDSSASHNGARPLNILLQLLITDAMILPAIRTPSTSLSGAFLIWSPLLLAFCSSRPALLTVQTLISHLQTAINTTSTSWTAPSTPAEATAQKEGFYKWLLHILSDEAWIQMLGSEQHQRVLGDIIEASFMEPTAWNLKLANSLLQDEDLPIQNREDWVAIMSVTRGDASSEVEMEVDRAVDATEAESPVVLEEKTEVIRPVVKEKISGPQKFIGLWKPRPIGWLVDDEPDD